MRHEGMDHCQQGARGGVGLYESVRPLPASASAGLRPISTESRVRAEDYLGLVHHFAARYGRLARARNIPMEDLVGEGTFALLRAAREWREDGAKFSTFASRCIQCRIWKLGAPGPAETAGNNDALAWVESIMARVLTGREAEVVSFRHGLQGERPHELGEIADALGVSHQRVSQLYGVAIDKLRRAAGQDEPAPATRRSRLVRVVKTRRRPVEPACTLRPRGTAGRLPLTAPGRLASLPRVGVGPAVRTTPGGMA